jgi:phospholipase/carboxylesterase
MLLKGRYDRIIIGGFSQGAVVSYNAFLRHKRAVGGVIGLSGYTPPFDKSQITEEKKKTPIFR